jgi:hypothetical protein
MCSDARRLGMRFRFATQVRLLGGAAADECTAGSCGAADGRVALGSPAPPPASGADIMPLPSCCGFLGARWARRESLRSQARVCGPLPILKLAYEAS